MCHGLIDYDFYVPAGVSQGNQDFREPCMCSHHIDSHIFSLAKDDLSYLANTLGKGYDGALDNDCLRAIKKNICSKVYLPCGSDDIDFEVCNVVNYLFVSGKKSKVSLKSDSGLSELLDMELSSHGRSIYTSGPPSIQASLQVYLPARS